MSDDSNVVEAFFIGDHYYRQSRTMMSSVYLTGKRVHRDGSTFYRRYDYGFLQRDLKLGKEVVIRQATQEERAWADARLLAHLLENA